MARMIPPKVDQGCTSPGEREIFQRLRDDPRTRAWIALHSLDIAQHVRRVSGEADFVIIVPNKGVLCLEVKACTSLRRNQGAWYYGTDPEPDYRGPFRQASEAMHSLRRRLIERRPDLSKVVFWSAVIFPYIDFQAQSPEWHSWQVVDRRAFISTSTGQLAERVMDSARAHLANLGVPWFYPLAEEPYSEQCEAICHALRPDFEYHETQKIRLGRAAEETKRYTEEQYSALDAMQSNPRIIFDGPAGTGKTFLAIEAARRGSLAGNKTLFLCFNRLLGQWLNEQMQEIAGLTVGTLHKHLLDVSGHVAGETDVRNSDFWEIELPQIAIESLVDDVGGRHFFDEVILDEAQDVMREPYLDFFDLSLKGGLASGRWRIFGDFQLQNIYGAEDPFSALRKRLGQDPPSYQLSINCRNKPRVAALAGLVTGPIRSYSKVLRSDDGLEPEFHVFRNMEEQRRQLIDVLEGLYADGFRGQDIVILSAHAHDTCAEAITAAPWAQRIRPKETTIPGLISHCTVHAFKGLEASVVILTDISDLSTVEGLSLMYVGVTRALDRLHVFAGSQAAAQLVSWLKDRASMKG